MPRKPSAKKPRPKKTYKPVEQLRQEQAARKSESLARGDYGTDALQPVNSADQLAEVRREMNLCAKRKREALEAARKIADQVLPILDGLGIDDPGLEEILTLPSIGRPWVSDLEAVWPRVNRGLKACQRQQKVDGIEGFSQAIDTFLDQHRAFLCWQDDFQTRFAAEESKPPVVVEAPPVAPASPFEAVLAFAQTLSAKRRRVLELVCQNGGSFPLREMALDNAIDWPTPYDQAWNSVMQEINDRLTANQLPWRLHRAKNCACLEFKVR